MQEPLQFPDAPSRAQSDRILNWMSKRFGSGKGCAWIIADREGGGPVGAIRINRIDREGARARSATSRTLTFGVAAW
jgi:RimJ/RimL family protein N-acetyltransferase